MSLTLQECIGNFKAKVTRNSLKDFVEEFNFKDWINEEDIPKLPSEGYARKDICMEPFEIVVLNWSPGAESAIHHHEGFYGFVYIVKGKCLDTKYALNGKVLTEDRKLICGSGQFFEEKDGIIHKISNLSQEENLVSVHFYYPALTNLKGLEIYDVQSLRIGVLNERAQSASWSESNSCFDEIKEKAFTFKEGVSSHEILLQLPKPNAVEIYAGLTTYYGSQAYDYDKSDRNSNMRQSYIAGINAYIAEDWKTIRPEEALAIAAGTGRRPVEIRELAKLNTKLTLVEMSVSMAKKAKERGLEVIESDWASVNLEKKTFDAITFLYSFGHIPTKELRLSALRKVYDHLKPGGRLYFDIFNLDDQTEWGPEIKAYYEEESLEQYGYDSGDVFYRRKGRKGIGFLHYFTKEEIIELVKAAGLKIVQIQMVGYAQNVGEIVDGAEGKIFIIATRD